MIRWTDEQWARIRKHFPEENIAEGRPGRKPVATRKVLEAVLWILNTGAQWHMLPQSYPNYKTVHRRFQQWVRDGTMEEALRVIARDLRDRGGIDLQEAFIDGTFSSAKKGVFLLARRSAAKGPRSWQSRTLMVFLSRYALRALRPTK